jgi:urease accessory protein
MEQHNATLTETKETAMEFATSRGDVDSELSRLRLLHLADSALPIGALAHSFGLETLVAHELLDVANLPEFLQGYLEEAGFLEAVFCGAGWRLSQSSEDFARDWILLNAKLSARKAARESRSGSGSLGRNFLSAVVSLEESDLIRAALQASKEAAGLIHHSVAFGLVGGVLKISDNSTVIAYLHQSVASLVSACQRLLPLGQHAATRILWQIKPVMIETAERSMNCTLDDAACFMPLLEWGTMEHPALTTRLFIS